MTDQPEKRSRAARAFWLLIYAALCACEFVVEALKDFASERITGHPPDDGDDDDAT